MSAKLKKNQNYRDKLLLDLNLGLKVHVFSMPLKQYWPIKYEVITSNTHPVGCTARNSSIKPNNREEYSSLIASAGPLAVRRTSKADMDPGYRPLIEDNIGETAIDLLNKAIAQMENSIIYGGIKGHKTRAYIVRHDVRPLEPKDLSEPDQWPFTSIEFPYVSCRSLVSIIAHREGMQGARIRRKELKGIDTHLLGQMFKGGKFVDFECIFFNNGNLKYHAASQSNPWIYESTSGDIKRPSFIQGQYLMVNAQSKQLRLFTKLMKDAAFVK